MGRRYRQDFWGPGKKAGRCIEGEEGVFVVVVLFCFVFFCFFLFCYALEQEECSSYVRSQEELGPVATATGG